MGAVMTIPMIAEKRFALTQPDHVTVAAYRWSLSQTPKAIVVIAHGMGEHARRYPPALAMLLENRYDLYGVDHRGHGVTLCFSTHPPGDFGPGGFSAVVNDLVTLVKTARRDNPGLPVILLGHSMGSIICQAFALEHSALIDGLVLVGTTAIDAVAEKAQSEVDLVAAMNRSFQPARTSFDWLSSDDSEVDAYIADPLCGFSLVPQSMLEFLSQGARLADPKALQGIRKELPLYILVGELDPLVSLIGDLDRLIARYREAGLAPIVTRYPQGRHEILNETNRQEVVDCLMAWLNAIRTSNTAAAGD
jgi:alpha-beta hydrolase superfamily lysophospholipase